MELLVATGIGTLAGCGVYLLLQARTFPVLLGLTLLSYATNVFIFAMGRLATNAPPIIRDDATHYADPLPQALVLTAIVISFAMTALVLALAVRSRLERGSDHVDAGLEPASDEDARP